jgi:hypothetical protein
MASADEEGLAALGLEAARLSGMRVILVSEWPGFSATPRKIPRLQQKKRVCGAKKKKRKSQCTVAFYG